MSHIVLNAPERFGSGPKMAWGAEQVRRPAPERPNRPGILEIGGAGAGTRTIDEWYDATREARRAHAMEQVRKDGRALYNVEKEFRGDAGVVLEAVRQYGRALGFADVPCRGDKHIVLPAVQQDGLALEFAARALQADEEIVLAAVEQCCRRAEAAGQHVLKQLGECDCDALERNGRPIVLAAVKADGQALRYAADAHREDREVVLAACAQHGWALGFAHRKFLRDREVVLAAVQTYGSALKLLDERSPLRKDRDLVIAAVKQDRFAIRYADEALQRDPEVLAARLEEIPEDDGEKWRTGLLWRPGPGAVSSEPRERWRPAPERVQDGQEA